MRRELLALACVGCNTVFDIGPTQLVDAAMDEVDAAPPPIVDRDRDDIPDDIDPCIASIADAKGDWEGDATLNEDDGCPFDYESIDTDGDGIYDECDPFVDLDGDRVRCVMAFQSAAINSLLWEPRANENATWNLFALNGLGGRGTGTVVANERIEAPGTTSFDMALYAGPPEPPATHGSFTVWLRTNATPARSDVGCEVRGDDTSSTLTLVGAPMTEPVAISRRLLGVWKLQATIEPTVSGRANVRCTAITYTSLVVLASVSAEVVLPPGYFGFGVDEANAILQGMTVIERDDAPEL